MTYGGLTPAFIIVCTPQPIFALAHSPDSSNMATSSTTQPVTGYTRIRQLNRFLPTDVQVHLYKNIGRNERVNVTDFLIGDDYTQVKSPYLPNELQDGIRNREITRKEWANTVRSLLNSTTDTTGLNTTNVAPQDCVVRSFEMLEMKLRKIDYVIRYITAHPMVQDNERFLNIVVDKCLHMYEETVTELAAKEPPEFEQNTRSNCKIHAAYNQMELTARRLLRTLEECQDVYQDLLAKYYAKMCDDVMNLANSAPGGQPVPVAIAMASH